MLPGRRRRGEVSSVQAPSNCRRDVWSCHLNLFLSAVINHGRGGASRPSVFTPSALAVALPYFTRQVGILFRISGAA
ncbi:hypothetical protein V5799_016822 [Amblyomma americanum]|uniref:Uncharacterized protein n=1 Tax=Amblyomma americanum TaxID=6943 RepID=A0AAQ4F416_AMBAM